VIWPAEAVSQPKGTRQGQYACDLRNPQGSCCLGNARRLMQTVRVVRSGALKIQFNRCCIFCNICYTRRMNWLLLTYSLPTGPNSSPRVTLWRRLRRVGAVAVSGGSYLLPPHEPCREAFVWLQQEIGAAGGEALILHVAAIA
jgi:hypothetical protein